jgi:preprotein translocase subunit SecF
MQLFKETNIEFIGNARYFVALSTVLILASATSIALRGGLKLGIDFKGGTLVYVKFKSAPKVDDIRQALESKGLAVSTLQPFEDGNELKIDLDLVSDDSSLSAGREHIRDALYSVYPAEPGKLDFNNASPEALAAQLKKSSQLAALPPDQIEKAAQALIDLRDDAPHLGLIRDYADLQGTSGVPAPVLAALPEQTYLSEFAVRGVEVVGPKIGRDLQIQAINATLAALAAMGVYLALRFEWIYGLAAVIAVFHDVFVTVGFFSFFDQAIDLNVIAALLTLVGYSVNDTIVIFDRVRENLKLTHRVPLAQLMNRSVNQTLSRTVLTSGLTFIPILFLYLFGGEVLRGFSFALLVGVIVGSYSTIFVASPIVLWWRKVIGVDKERRAGARTPESAAEGSAAAANRKDSMRAKQTGQQKSSREEEKSAKPRS